MDAEAFCRRHSVVASAQQELCHSSCSTTQVIASSGQVANPMEMTLQAPGACSRPHLLAQVLLTRGGS